MKDQEIRIFPTIQDLSIVAADLFVKLSKEGNGRFSIALSGGSTPKALYQMLAENPYRDIVRWADCYFFWGDERFVPLDHPDSNFRMAHEALLSKVAVPEQNIFPIRTEGMDPASAAVAYEKLLRNFFGEIPEFDLIFLGLGEDGHTASLFPSTNALNESDRWVAENFVEKLNTYRITFTFPVINRAANVVFLVSGESKAGVLKKVLEGPLGPERLPAQSIRPSPGKLIFLVDQASARKIDSCAD
jgi:6-phosphogluconolactonase